MSLPPVVFGIDSRYLRPLLVAMKSLAMMTNTDSPVLRVVVVHEQISSRAMATLRTVAKASGLSLDTVEIESFVVSPQARWPSAANIRLHIPRLLAADELCLYLDTDIIVLSDIRPLLATDLGSAHLGAVVDPLVPTLGGDMLPGRNELGMPEGSPYFNSGVMLMNLEAWRRDRLSERCLDLLARYPHYFSHPDQDVLNYLARDSWFPLDPSWNVYAASVLDTIGRLEFGDDGRRRARLLNDESSARILHFAGPLKPWMAGFPPGGALDRYRSFENSGLPALKRWASSGSHPQTRRSP